MPAGPTKSGSTRSHGHAPRDFSTATATWSITAWTTTTWTAGAAVAGLRRARDHERHTGTTGTRAPPCYAELRYRSLRGNHHPRGRGHRPSRRRRHDQLADLRLPEAATRVALP